MKVKVCVISPCVFTSSSTFTSSLLSSSSEDDSTGLPFLNFLYLQMDPTLSARMPTLFRLASVTRVLRLNLSSATLRMASARALAAP